MVLLSTACAAMLQIISPCALPDDHVSNGMPLPASAVTEDDLAAVRGGVVPVVGIGKAGPASIARAIPVSSMGPQSSDVIREVVDNWTLAVAIPLVAAATAGGR